MKLLHQETGHRQHGCGKKRQTPFEPSVKRPPVGNRTVRERNDFRKSYGLAIIVCYQECMEASDR